MADMRGFIRRLEQDFSLVILIFFAHDRVGHLERFAREVMPAFQGS